MTQTPIPEYVAQYFWGDNLAELNMEKHKKYITQTLLDRGDIKAASWILNTLGKDGVKKLLPMLKLSPKSSTFWNLYLS